MDWIQKWQGFSLCECGSYWYGSWGKGSVLQRRAPEFPGVSSLHVCRSVHCIWDAGWRPKTWSRNIFSTLYATRSWARGSRWGSRLCVHTCPAPSHHLHPRPFLCRCRAHSAMRICVSLVLPSLPHLGLVLLWCSLLDSGFLCHSTDKSPSSTTGIVLKQTPYLCSLFH